MQRRHRFAGGFVLSVVLLTSCSSGGEGSGAGVGVREINTNVGLGIELEQTAPANIVVQRPQQRRLDRPESTLPPLEFELPKPVNRPCALAGPFDFPAEETGVVPKGRPKPGIYPWKIDGEVATGDGVFTVDDFESRSISDVKDHQGIPGAFTFAQTQTSYADARRASGTTTTVFRVVPDNPVENEQVASDAGKGVFIEQIIFRSRNAEGQPTESTFNPVPPVQLIGFPVKDGAGNAGTTQTGAPIRSSSGVDPNSGAQLTIQGTVKGKKQIDACGDRVDSWFVDAVQTYRYPTDNGQTETLEANYDYGIAPQFGGMLVYEHIEAPLEGPIARVDFRVGRVPERMGE